MYGKPETPSIATRIANCQDEAAIAARELNYLESQANSVAPRRIIRTPQRKANYNDKARFRRSKLKQIAYENYGCSSLAQIKDYLKLLGIKLDLRLTSAWVAIVRELHHEIIAAKAILDALQPQPIAILLAAMKEAIAIDNWSPCREALRIHSAYKDAAWKQLTATEKQQLTTLVPEAVKLLAAAKRSGIIADFSEDIEDNLYWVRVTSSSERKLVTSCGVSNFVMSIR